MPPKKDHGHGHGKKHKAPPVIEEPELVSLYAKREPLPPPEPSDATEAERAWRASRGAFVTPLPVWDSDGVHAENWMPQHTQNPFCIDNGFSSKVLPKSYHQMISCWRRAPTVLDPVAPEEPEPHMAPLPDLEEEEVAAPAATEVPNSKDAKGKEKKEKEDKPVKEGKKGKAGKEKHESEPPGSARMLQQASVSEDGQESVCVVNTNQFRTRKFELAFDDALPPLSQAMAAQFSIVGEHRHMLPKGSYLWEHIHPQDEKGKPIFNPHGKYAVRLFVHGCWRCVMIDDVVPVGSSGGGQCAPLLPSSAQANVIWPLLLAKALLKAFQADLRGPGLPVITALTGWLPFHSPLTWSHLQGACSWRPFCCLQMVSKVDPEGRRQSGTDKPTEVETKGGRKGEVPTLQIQQDSMMPPVPKLQGQVVEAQLQFLVCEVADEQPEEHPRQLRVKAGAWGPKDGELRPYVIRDGVVMAGEEEQRLDDDDEESDHEDGENMDDDDEDQEQRSNASAEDAGVQSSRGTPHGRRNTADGEHGTEGNAGDEANAEIEWPDAPPAPFLPKAAIQEYQEQLSGGFWIPFEKIAEQCATFINYMPQNERMIKAHLDTTWPSSRKKAYARSPNRLLRLCLEPPKEVLQREDFVSSLRDGNAKAVEARPPPFHHAIFTYEPLRLDPVYGTKEKSLGSGSHSVSCTIQSISGWQPTPPAERPIESIHLVAGGESAAAGTGTASRSVLLPSGEHWFLVLDDAIRAGSVLSVHVDATDLNTEESSIEFMEPAKALDEQGVPVFTIEPAQYPPQLGYTIWAKAEFQLAKERAATTRFVQLLSYLPDTAMRQHLTLSLLLVKEDENVAEPGARPAAWSVTTLLRSPLLGLMSLPLSTAVGPTAEEQQDAACRMKYVVLLEANVPSVSKGGSFLLQLALPPEAGSAANAPKEEHIRDGGHIAELATALDLRSLKADRVLRWRGATSTNAKRLVLAERLTAPHGSGVVTCAIRVEVAGVPQIGLTAELVAQLPPTQEMRPKNTEGATPEPLAQGAKVEPKEYNGRRNWMKCCRTVATASGMESVLFPHVLLHEGCPYVLYVRADPYKGPDNLDGGEWTLALFGSGDVEVGQDTMELDLEALVRKSWEKLDRRMEPGQDERLPRKERAKVSREAWLSKRAVESEAVPATSAPLQAAKHPNHVIADFLHLHTEVEPMLVVQDPYTVAPESPPEQPTVSAAEVTEAPVVEAPDGVGAEPTLEEEAAVAKLPQRAEKLPEAVAVHALGTKGRAEVRCAEIEATEKHWAQALAEMEAAKQRNAALVAVLHTWREESAKNNGAASPWQEQREEIRSGLQQRVNKCVALKEVIGNGDAELERIRRFVDEAIKAEVAKWNPELVETATNKLKFIEAFGPFKSILTAQSAKAPEEQLADPAEREEFMALLKVVQELREQLQAKRVALPADAADPSLIATASEMVRERRPEAPEVDPETA